jgi:hypothetical protein
MKETCRKSTLNFTYCMLWPFADPSEKGCTALEGLRESDGPMILHGPLGALPKTPDSS